MNTSTTSYNSRQTERSIHFLGIGGIGVSALAQLAITRGASVSGSDINTDTHGNSALARLIESGAVVYNSHVASNISGETDLLVCSAAIHDDNAEIIEAKSRGIRIVSRAEYLSEAMAAHRGPRIAVAGTHGKTTTTGMIGVMLQEVGLDPTVFVGGEIPQLGGNFRIGSETGPFVAEACEAYDSFLTMKPDIAVITNIEADHLDHYHDFEGVLQAFEKFLSNVSADGTVVGCMDDAGVRRLERTTSLKLNMCRYGIDFGIDCKHGIKFSGTVSGGANPSFSIRVGNQIVKVRMNVPGRHNVQNALAALVVGTLLSIPAGKLALAVGAFTGAERRQEVLATIETAGNPILVIDDYAHHPTEISATIEAMRASYPGKRLTAVFQPHLFSRTRDFMEGFANSLSEADVLLVTGIYAARETLIPGVLASDIVSKAASINPNLTAIFVPNKADLPRTVAALTLPGDITLFIGAGDIRTQAERYIEVLKLSSRA